MYLSLTLPMSGLFRGARGNMPYPPRRWHLAHIWVPKHQSSCISLQEGSSFWSVVRPLGPVIPVLLSLTSASTCSVTGFYCVMQNRWRSVCYVWDGPIKSELSLSALAWWLFEDAFQKLFRLLYTLHFSALTVLVPWPVFYGVKPPAPPVPEHCLSNTLA